jgi:hydrogenase-4 component F
LMSGVLLSVAFYAVLRYKVVVDRALGPGFMRGLLVAAGLLSLGVAASLLVAQRDYKRMLAYSSIEHMGLIALGAAAGNPLAMASVLLHILGHGLAKSVSFLGSGEILLSEGTTEIAGVRGLLASRPLIGGSFGLGLLALLGLPPFSLFASEVGIARAGLQVGLGWAIAVALILLLVIFAAIFSHGQQMLLGEYGSHAGAGAGTRGETVAGSPTGAGADSLLSAAPLVGGLVLAAVLGVSIWPIERLLYAAATIVGRS